MVQKFLWWLLGINKLLREARRTEGPVVINGRTAVIYYQAGNRVSHETALKTADELGSREGLFVFVLPVGGGPYIG